MSNMKWIGDTLYASFGGRLFRSCDESAEAIMNAEWAQKILDQPACIFPNGRNSHTVANEIMEKSEDILIDYMFVTA